LNFVDLVILALLGGDYCNYSAYQNMSIDVDSDENVENNK
jgi:hypothetical protein